MKKIILNKIVYPIRLLVTILQMRQRRKKMASNNKTEDSTNNEQFIHRNGGIIVNNMNDMVIGMDLWAGNYTFVNPSCYKMFGYTQAEYLAMPIKDTMLPSSYKAVQEAIKREFERYFRGETACPEATLQMQQYCKDGTIKWVEASATTIINDKKELVEIVAITRDIDSKKKSELQILEQRNELTKANDSKNIFFSIISHDLRNQITALSNITGVFSDYFNRMSPEEAAKHIGMLSNSVANLMFLFEDLLLWSRSVMGGIEINISTNNINKIAEATIAEFNTQAQQKQIELLYSNTTATNIVLCDFFMISTILRNLLSNAIKFSHNSSKISVLVNNHQSGEYVILSVKDEGVGMSTEKIDQLFKLNTKVSTLGTANEKGTGIGLILCKEFVDKHKCSIWVVSEPSKGTTFSFTLPLPAAGSATMLTESRAV